MLSKKIILKKEGDRLILQCYSIAGTVLPLVIIFFGVILVFLINDKYGEAIGFGILLLFVIYLFLFQYPVKLIFEKNGRISAVYLMRGALYLPAIKSIECPDNGDFLTRFVVFTFYDGRVIIGSFFFSWVTEEEIVRELANEISTFLNLPQGELYKDKVRKIDEKKAYFVLIIIPLCLFISVVLLALYLYLARSFN